ncbi:cystathionine beta-synthase [Maribacter sp. MJ134]|uniref:PLP-dependent transferase n=1 Tax=Maribacter sp. MJ134 TaxID=2496865 RepID=UPI000F845AEB|nr:PLP-dependent transferase [Maribacter sp. MJ134]AZQ57973.1 cystathionine beta-synthase [Maribacter sp. MJ134]
MEPNKTVKYIEGVLENLPPDWLNLTTHRLDIYEEELAKTQFLSQFEKLYQDNNTTTAALNDLPTAYDYIRLGHPLSSVLEWAIAEQNRLKAENVISFSSKTMPILAVLRKNALEGRDTQIIYKGELPEGFDADVVRRIYGYDFDVKQVDDVSAIATFNGSTIFISQEDTIGDFNLNPNIDFFIGLYPKLGSIIAVNGAQNQPYIAAIQHVRRRESIAMTPANALIALQRLTETSDSDASPNNDSHSTSVALSDTNKLVLDAIEEITDTDVKAVVGSSGLSIQYAVVMGLIHHALDNHKGKAIKILVPPNCYGGTNDQARRVAASVSNVEVVDLPVDGDNDMAQSIDRILDEIANQDAIPYIIAEIPTNPRVEVPYMQKLKAALTKVRKTPRGKLAIEPVFILDQTFCPNTNFLGEGEVLSNVNTIAYVSGSKFPSGGKCTAGYCTSNKKAERYMEKIALHLKLCDNEATALQQEILATQLPSMNQRIEDAYQNTRAFVDFIKETLPEAKINFVSKELAAKGFTPSVFSLDLPTKGNTAEEKESYKRALNHKLIHLMITKIPHESKYCVSYGQLKGCYWTIPATSTQGTTKEGDKDYIARVALSPDMDLELHKKVFLDFVATI